MNEITKIHLGRQAFAIAVDAHKELRAYLDAIKKQVSDESVVNEVELRMAELLAERGVTGEKVILPADVDFLKEQLGNPKDFKEDGDTEETPERSSDTKRFFRDTDDAILAGVASGLAKYFGIDVWIIRILFIIGAFTGGWGILLYVVLWLLVPEAKTSSDRLQMVGKAVTVDSLKEVVNRADIKGAAKRANNSLAGPINSIFHLILKIIGIGFVVAGLSMLFGLLGTTGYVLLHNGSVVLDNLFPIGLKEHLLVYIAAGVAGIVSLFVILFGMAIFQRKWPIHTWITGVLVGLLLIGMAAGGALAADTVPNVRDRYNANLNTAVRTEDPFDRINVIGDADIRTQTSSTYSVSLKYFDHPDLSNVKTTVTDGTLTIDTRQFSKHQTCNGWCIPSIDTLTITVNSPNIPQFLSPDMPKPVMPESAPIYQY